MVSFLLGIWNLANAAWGMLMFAVGNPILAGAIALTVILLVLWLGKKILTLPLSLAWRGIRAGARRVPGLVASGAQRVPGLASKAKGAATAGARRLPQARQWVTGSRRNFAIVGGIVALLIIGALYWSLSGTRPAPPAQTAKEWVAKAREYLPPWLGGNPPAGTPGSGSETPVKKATREAKEKAEEQAAKARSDVFKAEAQKGAQDLVKGVQDGSVGQAAGDGVRKGYSALKESAKKAFEPPPLSPAEQAAKEQKQQAERDAAMTALDEAYDKLPKEGKEGGQK